MFKIKYLFKTLRAAEFKIVKDDKLKINVFNLKEIAIHFHPL